MEIIPCGTECTIKLGQTPGVITEVSIRFTSVAYEVSYFMNNEYRTTYFHESELKIGAHEKVKIGFKS